jgi:hypothetical protein
MIYQVIADESAARSNYIRVLDNEKEDYLYPAEYFYPCGSIARVERTLLHVSGHAND